MMQKLFTLTEAKRLIPVVDSQLRTMQEGIRDLEASRNQLIETKPYSLEAMRLHQEIGFLLASVQESKAELDRLGVYVKDVSAGIIDFPSKLGSEIVHLSWKQGNDTITHYHRLIGDTSQPHRLSAAN